MQYYKPEDYTIDETFITAQFQYNQQALYVLNGHANTKKYGINTEKLRNNYGIITGKKDKLSITQKRIIEQITENNRITINALAAALNVSISTIEKNIRHLKTIERLRRFGSKKDGYWEVLNG